MIFYLLFPGLLYDYRRMSRPVICRFKPRNPFDATCSTITGIPLDKLFIVIIPAVSIRKLVYAIVNGLTGRSRIVHIAGTGIIVGIHGNDNQRLVHAFIAYRLLSIREATALIFNDFYY